MVKNKKGGKGHKKMARKNVKPKYYSRKLRTVREDGEMYARILNMSGGGHATILCADKKERTLVIRGKFKGRNKRDNTVRINSIVLVGLRSVSFGEVVSSRKKEKADLIFVYNEQDINELMKIEEIYEILSDDMKQQNKEDEECGLEFTNYFEEEEEVKNTIEKSEPKPLPKPVPAIDTGGIKISWDEI